LDEIDEANELFFKKFNGFMKDELQQVIDRIVSFLSSNMQYKEKFLSQLSAIAFINLPFNNLDIDSSNDNKDQIDFVYSFSSLLDLRLTERNKFIEKGTFIAIALNTFAKYYYNEHIINNNDI
jgi:hypothetical protein